MAGEGSPFVESSEETIDDLFDFEGEEPTDAPDRQSPPSSNNQL